MLKQLYGSLSVSIAFDSWLGDCRLIVKLSVECTMNDNLRRTGRGGEAHLVFTHESGSPPLPVILHYNVRNYWINSMNK